MDMTAHPKLDPKLKDTYDRIMGTSVGVKPPQPTVALKPEPTEVANTQHAEEKNDPQVGAAITEEKKAPVKAAPTLSHIAYNAEEAKKQKQKTTESHHANPQVIRTDTLLFPLLIGAGGVIFFVFYAIFWMSFFGM